MDGEPEGFRFLPVPYTDALEYYLPAYLDHQDYPALVPKDERITTIAVPAVLAVYDWPTDTDRHRRMLRFVDYLVERLPKLQTEAGFHKAWKDVNLAATVPGWQRFKPLTERLEKADRERPKAAAATTIIEEAARKQAERAAPGNSAEQERLFQEFLAWRRKQQPQ